VDGHTRKFGQKGNLAKSNQLPFFISSPSMGLNEKMEIGDCFIMAREILLTSTSGKRERPPTSTWLWASANKVWPFVVLVQFWTRARGRGHVAWLR